MANGIDRIRRDAGTNDLNHIIENACGKRPDLTHGRKFRLAMQRNLAAVVRFVVGIGLIVHRALMAGSMLVCKCRQGLWPIYRW